MPLQGQELTRLSLSRTSMEFSSLTTLSHFLTFVLLNLSLVSTILFRNKFKRLPPHIVHYDTLNEVIQRFGYDPVDDDYKIVRVVSYPVKVEVEEDVDEVQEVDSEVRVDVEVYSAKLNAWRKLEQDCLAQEIIECQTANYNICVNGILCCIAEGFSGIIAFDLNQEVFNCDVEFPVSGKYYRIISINDSTIGLITINEDGDEFNLWKLDDVECLHGGSGLEPSWSLANARN
ncbi:hypothetical protein POM88_014221 [Heracleum sosnowskyi]|uniref:F-box associated beta-propeller type 3 domain-containing protein n=1 Tax=Heracleum sosnowskyi TaxID=360622 RepID=A0AAD8IZZ8_9APIA|nr:hypothetical protein POM88_014221 [Heracleum sosnowskyi]